MHILQMGNKNTTNITHLNKDTEWDVFHTCALNDTIQTSTGLFWGYEYTYYYFMIKEYL